MTFLFTRLSFLYPNILIINYDLLVIIDYYHCFFSFFGISRVPCNNCYYLGHDDDEEDDDDDDDDDDDRSATLSTI